LAKHLFHGLCLDQAFDGAVDHYVKALVQPQFLIKKIVGEGCGGKD
jgi:hypothetical protein